MTWKGAQVNAMREKMGINCRAWLKIFMQNVFGVSKSYICQNKKNNSLSEEWPANPRSVIEHSTQNSLYRKLHSCHLTSSPQNCKALSSLIPSVMSYLQAGDHRMWQWLATGRRDKHHKIRGTEIQRTMRAPVLQSRCFEGLPSTYLHGDQSV